MSVDVELSDGTGDLLHVVGQLVVGVGVPGRVPPGGGLAGVEVAHEEAERRYVEVGGVTRPSHNRVNYLKGLLDTVFSSEAVK